MESKGTPSRYDYLAAAAEVSGDAVIGKDSGGIIRHVNRAAESLFGYPAAELVGRPASILIPPDRADEEAAALSRAGTEGLVQSVRTARLTKSGGRLDVSLVSLPVRDASGRIAGASDVVRIEDDSSGSKAHSYLGAIVQSSDDAIISKSLDGIIQSFNAAAERMFGYKAAEVVGKPVTILIPRDRQDEEVDILSRLRRGERVDHFETVRVRKDGRYLDISLTVSPVRDAAGTIIGVSKIARDVTERNETARALAAERVERERLLESERLARAEAERANRVKDDFVAMVSHELRTPLNAILGWTDLLMTTRPDAATVQHGLEIVARNTRIQSQLISDLLDISRIVSGKLWLDIQSVDPVVPIEGSLESVQHAAEAKGVEIRSSIDPDVGMVPGDPARLQQIVWNLLTNAIKFTPSGGHVFVGLRRNEDFAEITVSDSGIGIRPELLPDLFERFRHSGATTRSYGGLGLGLSIVKHLAELHGGHARAQSEGEGKGSKFTIEIPLARKGAAPARPPRDSSGEGSHLSQDRISFRGITVLVVEDEADTRDLLRRILEAHQVEVLTASSASEALACLATARPHILISDIGLPNVDGYDLMRQIRQAGGVLASVPAIALTAFARSEDRTRALRAGYQTHLAKPVEPSELLATVESLVDLTIPARKS